HRLRIGQPVEDGAAQHAAPRQAQHLLEGGIGEDEAAVGLDDRDQRGEMIECGECPVAAAGVRRALARREGIHWFCEAGAGSLASSRLMAATSASLRAMPAFSSATRSRYFW